MTSSQAGRPKKSTKDLLNKRIEVRVTGEEYDTIKQWAKALRLSHSELGRRALLHLNVSVPVSAENLSIRQDFARVGNNLNQAVLALHQLNTHIGLSDRPDPVAYLDPKTLRASLDACTEEVARMLPLIVEIRALLLDQWQENHAIDEVSL